MCIVHLRITENQFKNHKNDFFEECARLHDNIFMRSLKLGMPVLKVPLCIVIAVYRLYRVNIWILVCATMGRDPRP